ncbi:helix-turn-helix transcriptional regulator [Actinacidiphila sp. ITFR-21]|uniref:helix-turn-helix transcriptional regulator n=1 Tax=Actinacidiphila sp. ITFR-21 TaxID=3075199 RepID=UPI002889A9A0|nr:helix-turn-helix domain-containing protein [Streptomyces sp. ITFR-21]WNI19241.1 helix-turn-helix domain-containing protein [Streptomyces sp. ITFR-21]
MSSDDTGAPATPTEPEPIRFGQRLQILRERRGMTREVLAGLVGKSTETIRAIEKGRHKAPGLDMVLALAEALRVRDLTDLVGTHTGRPAVGLFAGPGHARLPEVRDAINSLSLTTRHEAPPAAHLQARLGRAWSARHSSPDHREVIGRLLPDLIRDAQLAVRQAEAAVDRRAAQAVLSEVYSLSQFFIAYQADAAELLWRVAERGMVAAQEAEDPHAIGVAAWLAAQAHRDSGPGHYDAADAVTLEVLQYLEPLLPDATTPVLAIAGALRFEAGYTAARRGDTGTAWAYWDQARTVADRLPADYYHPATSFSRAIMGAHATTVAVELHAGGEAARQAVRAEAAVIPSRPRRARHRIEQARAWQLDGQPDVALATLAQAHEAAPETIRYNGYARKILLEETESTVAARRERAARLAVKIGLLS